MQPLNTKILQKNNWVCEFFWTNQITTHVLNVSHTIQQIHPVLTLFVKTTGTMWNQIVHDDPLNSSNLTSGVMIYDTNHVLTVTTNVFQFNTSHFYSVLRGFPCKWKKEQSIKIKRGRFSPDPSEIRASRPTGRFGLTVRDPIFGQKMAYCIPVPWNDQLDEGPEVESLGVPARNSLRACQDNGSGAGVPNLSDFLRNDPQI